MSDLHSLKTPWLRVPGNGAVIPVGGGWGGGESSGHKLVVTLVGFSLTSILPLAS